MEPERTALVVMDMQRFVVDHYGGTPDLLERVAAALDRARRSGVAVVYVKLAFRPGHPEVSSANRVFEQIRAAGAFAGDDPDWEVHPAIAPREGDVTVLKKRVSAFAGNDLDMLLRARGIRQLVLAGIATSGVVLSTALAASDLDYELVVLEDGCADTDPDAHRVLMGLFARRGEVMSVEAWISGLGG